MSLVDLPGVEKFDLGDAIRAAHKNLVVTVFGDSKTGKTHFAVRSVRPLFIVYLDTNPNLDFHLAATAEEFGDEVYTMRVPPMNGKGYHDFSQEEAEVIVGRVEEFAEEARKLARERAGAGLSGGTFLIDGALYLKGYYEKAELGESNTLGGRPKKGQKGWPTQLEYAKSNSRIYEFTSSFIGADLDAIFVWEGRRVWKKVLTDDGRWGREPTDDFKSTRPDRLPFAMTAEVETLKVFEDVVMNNQVVGKKVKPKIKIHWNSYGLHFDNLLLPAKNFIELKELFLSALPDAPPDAAAPIIAEARDASTAQRVGNTGGIGGSVVGNDE